MKKIFTMEERTEILVASFGLARLVQSPEGRFELRGGSHSDHLEAREWVSLFQHEVVIRQH
jgi:hypothetical protein